MSTLVELLIHHYTEWPEHCGEPVSTIVQGPRGTLWLNRPEPNYNPEWIRDEWRSDYVDDARLTDTADDHRTAIVTKEMWEEARRNQAKSPENDVDNW